MPSLIDGAASLRSLLRPSSDGRRTTKLSGGGGGGGAGGVGGIFKMFKLLPMLTTGCKMAALLGRHSTRSARRRLVEEGGAGPDGELTYMRARVERVVGSKDSEAFYMINPDDGSDNGGAAGRDRECAPELSIFLVRKK
uniref:Uncharacterized protein n=1 Tax=Oryza barthii TaxID=65489 RepID=A0A0D3H1C7_9ORYZ